MFVLMRRYRAHVIVFGLGLLLGLAAYARVGPGAASIDPGVQAGLLLVISVTLAATAGAAGAVIGASIAADAARDSARTAQLEAQADRDAARQDRFANRTRELAAQALVSGRRYRRGVRNYVYYASTARLNLGDTFPEVLQELRLIVRSTDTIDAIDTFADTTLRLQDFEGAGPFDQAGRKQFDTFDEQFGNARIAFEQAIRVDLGIEAQASTK